MKGDITYLEGKGFDVNPQNINKLGRPRKQLSVIISEMKELGYKNLSKSELVDVCTLMLSLTEDELFQIGGGGNYPMIMRVIANRLLSKRDFETIDRVLDRIYGKTIPQHEIREDHIINIVIT